MQSSSQIIVGYGLLGLVAGLLLLPWFLLVTVRSGIAEAREPLWVLTYYAVVFVPALIGTFVGWSRSRPSSA